MHMRQQSAEAVEHTRTVEPKLVGHFEQTLQVGRLIFFENVVDDEKATISHKICLKHGGVSKDGTSYIHNMLFIANYTRWRRCMHMSLAARTL